MSPQRLPAGKAIEETGDSPRPPENSPAATQHSESPQFPKILFEGDEPSQPAENVVTQKFELGASRPPEPPRPQETQLPEAYGTEKLTLNARDPHSLFAHWDLTKEQQHRYNTLSADGHLALRAYDHAHSNQFVVEVPLEPDSRHHFLNVPRAGTNYVGELGYYQPDRTWKTIATSGPAATPPDAPSAETDVIFSTPQALRAIQPASQKESEPPELGGPSVIPVTASHWPFEPKPSATAEQIASAEPDFSESQPLPEDAPPFVKRTSIKKWTPIQEHLLANMIRISWERREWISSAEIAELIRREVSPVSAPEIAWPFLSGPLVNISSPMGESPSRKGFWFNVNAELIIYGATEPNAQVTVAGRPVHLHSDGTFSCHFALPDGDHALAATAISPDNEHREAAMTFSRRTKYSG